RPHPTSTLFPYTTLFRSLKKLSETCCPMPHFTDENSRLPFLNRNMTERELPIPRTTLTQMVAAYRQSEDDIRAAYKLLVDAETRSEEHTSELQSPYDLVC